MLGRVQPQPPTKGKEKKRNQAKAGPPMLEKWRWGVTFRKVQCPLQQLFLPNSVQKHGLFESDNKVNVNFSKDALMKTGPYFWYLTNPRARFHFVLHSGLEIFLQSMFLLPDRTEQWGLHNRMMNSPCLGLMYNTAILALGLSQAVSTAPPARMVDSCHACHHCPCPRPRQALRINNSNASC